LNLRTFELGMISFRPDPAQFRTIAVYADSLAFIVSPRHPLAGSGAGFHRRPGRGAVCGAQCDFAAAAEGD
jgi:hypothetical protein